MEATLAYVLVLAVAAVLVEAAWWLMTPFGAELPLLQIDHASLLLRSLAITAMLAAVVLRYFYLQHGGTCVMVCVHAVGLSGMTALRRYAQLPLHAHRAGWGYLSRSPALGWDFRPWQLLWRLAGADHLHVNGLRNKFSEPDEVVVRAARSVQEPWFEGQLPASVPVFSSAQTGLQAHD
ncbi:MAG: hypothetical protein EBS99_17965, partial [Betaproteobacteria bacterium]|nr:hypothetical protein [Betaproteobacteria bacterium]